VLTSGLHDWVSHLGPIHYWTLTAAMTVALLGLAAFTFRRLQLLRLMEDTPTSRVRSAAQGFVELEGRVEPAREPLTSPLRAIPCVWWSYRIEELDPGARAAGPAEEAGRSRECFLIRDGTGACVVDPDRAHIVGVQTETWMKGTQRMQESVIRLGQKLYALGLFRTPEDHAEKAERREVGVLISEWQLNRIELARRFDANRDGQMDATEWDAAWQAATAQIGQRRAGQDPLPDLHVLCDPADRRPFVLSVLGERRLTGQAWFQSITGLLAAMLVGVFLLWFLSVRGLL
jgi:hypothetical protein